MVCSIDSSSCTLKIADDTCVLSLHVLLIDMMSNTSWGTHGFKSIDIRRLNITDTGQSTLYLEEPRYFEYFGRTSKPARYAGWSSLGLGNV